MLCLAFAPFWMTNRQAKWIKGWYHYMYSLWLHSQTLIPFDVVKLEYNLHPHHECSEMSTCQMNIRYIGWDCECVWHGNFKIQTKYPIPVMEIRLLIWVSKIQYRRLFQDILQIPSRYTNSDRAQTWKRCEIELCCVLRLICLTSMLWAWAFRFRFRSFVRIFFSKIFKWEKTVFKIQWCVYTILGE